MIATATPELGQLQLLDLSKVEISKFNPRQDVGDLTELAESIGQIGVLEPIVVVQRNGHYEAVAGSRRSAAARVAGLKQIPARIMSLDDAQQAAAALIENLQRKDLTPLEEAEAFRKYLDLTGCTQKELGQKIGRAPSTIANALRLLDAPKLVRAALERGDITAAHARVALTVPAEYASSLPLKKGVTVQDFEDQARDLKEYATFADQVKAAAAAARAKLAEGQTLTWATDEVWAPGRSRTSLDKILGKPPATPAGVIEGDFTTPSYRHVKHRPELHDSLCTCRAFAVVVDRHSPPAYIADRIGILRTCITPAGFKKYTSGLQAKKTRESAKDKVTPAQRAKAQREREASRVKRAKSADAAAGRALSGASRYSDRSEKVDPKFLKGGLDKEPARLALFAFATKMSSEWDPGWRAAVWRRIAAMPIKEVRERAVAWAAQAAIAEINSRKDEQRELQELVYGHFKVTLPAEPKKAKR